MNKRFQLEAFCKSTVGKKMISVNYKYSALALALITLKSHSAATLVPEMSQLNVGTAGAGSAILSEGASTAYSNPAAMSYLEDVHIAINMAMMALSIEYQDHRHPSLSSDNAGGAQPYGSVYAVAPISERSRIGLAIVATGGSGLDYGNDYAGRLSVNDLQLSVMQINPSLSYKISEKFSLGAGVQMDRATFEQRFLSQTASIESVSYALGYNLGATYLLSPEHRFGVTFRSKMEHELTGDLTIFNRQIDSRVGLVNAAKLEFSAYHQVNEPIAIVWSFGQEFWSVNEQTSIHLNETEISKHVDLKILGLLH
ncbi:long-chain fatty acid transport protein [Vibrio sp. JCM 19236]|nr:long-chain fatty acid transport protein [Vibrio sp. JCM 19236]